MAQVIFTATPASYAGTVEYSRCESAFGPLFAASSAFGLCALVFEEGAEEMLARLARKLPHARFAQGRSEHITVALSVLAGQDMALTLAPAAPTEFQLLVWQALRRVRRGSVATYADIARAVGSPTALRAVGSAIGANPFAILVPCHRIVPSNGGLGQYHWGTSRKQSLLAAETAPTGSEA